MNRPLVAAVGAYVTGLLLAYWFHPPLARILIFLIVILSLLLILTLVSSRKPKSEMSMNQARPADEPRGSRREEAPSANQEAKLEPPPVGCYTSEGHCGSSSGSGRHHFRIWFLRALLALAGWLNFAARTTVVSPVDLRVLLGQEPAVATVRGTLAETPRLKIIQRDEQEKWRSVARVSVRALRRERDFEPAAGEVLVSTPDVLGPAFFSGQTVEISGVIARPPLPLAEGLFDFRDYLATRGIYYQVKTDSTNDWRLLEPRRANPPLTDRFLNWSHQTLALGLPVEDEPLRLLWAMNQSTTGVIAKIVAFIWFSRSFSPFGLTQEWL